MTITTQVVSSSYVGNGLQNTYNINFPFEDDPDRIQVFLGGVLQSSGYTVEDAGPNWIVDFVTPPGNGVAIRIQRFTPITQEMIYVPNDEFPAKSHEAALDKLTMIAQELAGGDSETGSGLIDGTYGDIIVSGNGTIFTVVNDAITLAKMANFAGPNFMGRITGSGDPEPISPTAATALLNTFTSIAKGLVPVSGGGTVNYLRADGTFATPTIIPEWGDIIGSISDQADLFAALNSKANTTHTHIANDITDATAVGKSMLTAVNSAAQTALLDIFSSVKGLVPLSPGGTTTFLRADGTWQTPTGGGGTGLVDGDYVDITVTGSGTVMTIDPDVVTNAKMANMATATIKGRVTAATGDPEDLTGTQATTLLDVFTSSLKGVVPASGGGSTNFLRADGTWAAAGASIAWGSITGVLSNQTDLNTALNGKQASDAFLTSIAALGTAADKIIYTTGVDTAAESTITLLGRQLLDDANQATMQGTLGLVIGTNVQAFDADLNTIAGLTATTNNIIQSVSSAWASRTPTQVTATLDAMVGDSGSGGTKGLAPAPAAGDTAAEKFLKADGTWAVPASSGAPTGAIMDYAGSSAPSGWQLCDGSALNRTTFAALFAIISTTFGAGDGSTTFNVPDLRGKSSLGAGTGTITESRAAANFNTSDIITVASNANKWNTGMGVVVTTTGTLPTGIIAATTYFVRRLSATTIELYDTLANAVTDRNPDNSNDTTGRVNITATGSGTHTLTHTLSARTLGDMLGAENHGLASSELPSHAHIGAPQTGVSNVYNTSSATDSYDATANTQNLGGSLLHNTMQPSLVLNKIIKT